MPNGSVCNYKTAAQNTSRHISIIIFISYFTTIDRLSSNFLTVMKGSSTILAVILFQCLLHVTIRAHEQVGGGSYVPVRKVPSSNPCDGVIQDFIEETEADQVQTVTPQDSRNNVSDTREDETVAPVGSTEEDRTVMSLRLGRKRNHPAGSCSEIRDSDPSANSRHYWLKGEGEPDAGRIYCDYSFVPPSTVGALAFNSSEIEVGWMRLLDLDMHQTHSHCPEGLLQIDSPRKACANSDGYGCNSITLNTHGVPYSRVCGMASGYRYHSPEAFLRYDCPDCENNIDKAYLDGVSITYGSPRTHIWSYTAAWSGEGDQPAPPKCPCADGSNLQSPEFVGEDYYCEEGDGSELWSGKECGGGGWSCCQHRDLPWFCKELPEPTTQDLEVRFCIDEGTENENVYVEMIQLLVQ